MTEQELERISDNLYDQFVDPESQERSIPALTAEILTRPKEEAVWISVHIAASLDHEDAQVFYETLREKM